MAHGTKLGRLAQDLADLNPWWRSLTWADADPDLRAARSSGLDYESACLHGLESGGLYVLRGPRRVGKTVATKQAIARLTASGIPPLSIVRLAVDGWAATDLRTVVQNVTLPRIPEDGHRWWFIDEITGMAGDWAAAIKWLRDNVDAFRGATVVVTGSSAPRLTEAIGLWAGRRGTVVDGDRTMLPIGFRTFVDLLLHGGPSRAPRLPLTDVRSRVAVDAFDQLVPWLGDLTRLWDLYLQYGGFPESVAAADAGIGIPTPFVEDLFSVIFRDVLRDSQASETAATDLFSRLMAGMASPTNQRQVGVDVAMSHQTVARHISYLTNGYLSWSCPQKHEGHWLPLPKAQAKVYAIDPIVARLPHLRRPTRPDVEVTVLNEMMVGMAIRRAAVESGQSWNGDEFLFHARTPTRKEIDFVSPLFGGAAIEGKFIEDGTWKGEAATLDASPWKGILATRSILDTRDRDRAWAVPSGLLAYLIDT